MATQTDIEKVAALEQDMLTRGVPEHLIDGLALYLVAHIQPGHFLTAVLSNDLREAIGRGDTASIAGLKPLVVYLYNRVPGNAWGNAQNVSDWLNEREEN